MIDILAFGSHPDDIEFGCGGVLAKMAAQNKQIVLVDLTSGEKGTNGSPEERRRESLASAQLIGAKRIFLDFIDCEIFDTYENRLKLVKVIREYRPRLILAPYWKGEQNHPDHLACGLMARYACRYARFPKILPEIPAYTPEGILHYLYPTYDEADFLVDISDYVDVWKQMMACHKSQMKTYDYMEWTLRLASKLGLMIRKPYAQGFAKGNPIEIEDLMTVAKGAAEI
jgi:bacillithiol biosynthesis deacetylase BshB1